MTVELWGVYLAAAVGLSVTPGPNGLLVLTHGARFGFRPAVATVLGGAAGFLLVVAVSLAGMGALLMASDWAFAIARWVGAAYLVYLGVRLWFAPVTPVVAADPTPEGVATGRVPPAHRLFLEGFLVAASNPKGILFFAAFLPQFMQPDLSFAGHLFVLGGTFVLVEIAYELMLARMAFRVAPWLQRHGRLFHRVTGATFIGIGALLATARR